ncbi:MAG: glycosyltransferase family 39 protein [Acidobacteria bacterium]|nr:glycosyltransferase family 39 protein [Acidobacteriota bacterium]
MIGATIRRDVTLRRVAYLILASALIGGSYGRLAGFGERQLTEDEYYFAEGVDKILKQGIPRFDGGGYYVQGLLPQYLTAASFELFGGTNTALRLPALLFGLLVPLLAYRYARLHLPAPLPLVLSAALLASSWEIEFSRFGRMYTALQCATLAFVYRFDRSIIGPDWKRQYRAHGWLVIATLCHLQGAILAPLLFWPCLGLDNRDRFPDRGSVIQYSFVTAVVAALVGLIATFDFRRWGAMDPFPIGYVPPRIGFLRVPGFLFWSAGDPFISVVILGALTMTLVIGLVLARRGVITGPQVGLAPLVVSALLHQGILAALIATALVLRYGIRRGLWESPRQKLLVVVAGSLFLCWAAVGASAGKDWIKISGASSWMGALRRTFFSWPNWTDALVQPWAANLPVLGVLALLSIAVLLMSRARAPWIEIFRGPAGILVYAILVFGVFRYFYESTRYHFLFYPVVLATVMAASYQLAGLWRGLLLFVAAFTLSGDFNPSHIAAAGKPSAAFRTGPFAEKEDLWYPRPDYQSAADYLQRISRNAPDALFVVHYCPPVARQLQLRRYASYLPRSSFGFYHWSRERGTRDIWKRRLLLSTREELREASRSDQAVWLIRPLSVAAQLQPEVVWGERLERVAREFLSRDGRIEVLKVSLKL